jgi:hypothetical protein
MWTQTHQSYVNPGTPVLCDPRHSNRMLTQTPILCEPRHINLMWTQAHQSYVIQDTPILCEPRHTNHMWTQAHQSYVIQDTPILCESRHTIVMWCNDEGHFELVLSKTLTSLTRKWCRWFDCVSYGSQGVHICPIAVNRPCLSIEHAKFRMYVRSGFEKCHSSFVLRQVGFWTMMHDISIS